MKRWIAVALLLAAVSPSHGADSTRATIGVAASVPARLTLKTIGQTEPLELQAADVQRGFVDVAASYLVSTNARSGYLLRFAPRLGLASRVDISGAGLQVAMLDSDIEVVRSGSPGVSRLEFRYRLHLSPDASPGRYALPLHVSVATL